jgi:hypothetical protein
VEGGGTKDGCVSITKYIDYISYILERLFALLKISVHREAPELPKDAVGFYFCLVSYSFYFSENIGSERSTGAPPKRYTRVSLLFSFVFFLL